MTPTTAKKISIFLADDDEDDQFLFRDALKETGLETVLTSAGDGVELMKLLKEKINTLPDVIFLDLNMPRKNGFECLDEIKQAPELRNVPVVMFSTTAQTEEVNKAYKKGASHYICKPGNFDLLTKAIKNVLSINWKSNIQSSREQFILK